MSSSRFFGGSVLLIALSLGATLAGATPTASTPYTLAIFTSAVPTGGGTKPDDLAISADGKDLWIGYGNGACTFGPSGIGTSCPTGTPANSNLVEFDIGSGSFLRNLTIPGHLDGLKIDPQTNDIWATQNEDGNPTFVIVNHKTGKFKAYAFAASPNITGGMDDLVFSGKDSKDVFIVTSSQAATTTPVIVELKGSPKKTSTAITSGQLGNPAHVWNVVANADEINDTIGDPDSMTLDPAGELLFNDRSLDSNGDESLYIVRLSTATHPLLRVPLTVMGGAEVELNDVIFTTSTAGTLYITDTGSNTIYTLTKPYFPANEIYGAEVIANDVGLVDMNTGIVSPVVTGLNGPHVLAFAPTSVAIAP
jgi:hypothetical protein